MSQSTFLTLVLSCAIFGFGCSQQDRSTSAHGLCMSSDQAQENLATENSSRFIVTLKDRQTGVERFQQVLRNAVLNDNEFSVTPINDRMLQLKISKNVRLQDAVAEMIDSREIEFLEPDYEIQLQDEMVITTEELAALSNDPGFNKQWAHAKVQSEKAWQVTKGSRNVVVGVVDSGVDFNHPDLAGNIWQNPGETLNGRDDDGNGLVDDIRGWDFANNDNNPMAEDSRSFHGTHVAGTIAAVANNGQGGAGHAPNVLVMPLRYLGANGSGYTSDAIRAIDYAVRMGVKILNNSWGSFSRSQALEASIARAARAGVLFVAAAGNNGRNNDSTPFFPASYALDNVLAVAASTSADQLASFSHFGFNSVDVAAPGLNIYSTRNGNSYQMLSGTSMAAPLVSAVAALVWSVRPDFTYRDVKAAIMNSVDRLNTMTGKLKTGGRVNASRALTYALRAGKLPDNGNITEDSNEFVCQ